MDTVISNEVVSARRNKAILLSVIVVIALVAAIWFLRSSIKSSIDSSEITTSAVEIGNIENTLNASREIILNLRNYRRTFRTFIQSFLFSTKKYGQGIGLTLVKEILLNHQLNFR
ncbi:MAG: hypothetical protein WKF91_12740 [Segetibacter sp.]